MSLAPGSTFGPFKIIEPLGRGGMASVFKAYEPGLDRYVALKVLPVESVQDEASAERFRREARVIARLEHPNITPIHSFGIDEATHVPWMAMRLISGGTMSNRLTMRLTPARAVSILRGVADALDYAHGKGVMHRDVKPANILLDEHGRVYLADFGIARLVEGATALTAAGLISGTPNYMAPEQATGQALDHRLDIYALGVVAYEALAGKVPFPGDNPIEVLMKHVQAPVPDVPELPDEVMAVLEKALAKKPEDRWESAGALVGALETAIASMPEVSARPTDPGMTSVLTASGPAPTGAAARATKSSAAAPTTAGPVTATPTRVARTREAAGATASADPTVLSPAPVAPGGEPRGGTGLALIAGGAALVLFVGAMAAFIVLRARTAPGPGETAAATSAASTLAAPTLAPAPLPSPRLEPSAAPSAPAVAPAVVDHSAPAPATTLTPRTLPPLQQAPPPTRAAAVTLPPVTVPPTTAAPAPAANGVVRLDVVAVQPAFGAMSASVAIDVTVDGRLAQQLALRFDGTTAFARSRRRQTYEIGGLPAGRRTVGVVVRPDGGGQPMRATTEMDVTAAGSTAVLDVRLRGNGEGDVKFR